MKLQLFSAMLFLLFIPSCTCFKSIISDEKKLENELKITQKQSVLA